MILKKIAFILFVPFVMSCAAQKNAPYTAKLLLSENGIAQFTSSKNELVTSSLSALDEDVVKILAQPVIIPQPTDAGGGYSHEKHKQNYAELYKVAISQRLAPSSQKIAYIKEMFTGYSAMYKKLPLHPKRKENHPAGKLFWQGLNETVWLFYTIQSYDLSKEFLTASEQKAIENDLLRPMVKFLSEDSYETFNKIHNHGTWSVAAVGMTGFVLNDKDMVDRAIYGSKKDGKTGFIAQIDALFSIDGFYAEGPYYHRYAMLPFIAFAEAIEKNKPEVNIFNHKNSLLKKAVTTLVQLTDESGTFYPINDAIKSKTWESDEVIFGTNIAYSRYKDETLLPIIKKLGAISFTDAGAIAAAALNPSIPNTVNRPSVFIEDGPDGGRGGIALMRSPQQGAGQLDAVFKFATQGMGHGHFDRLAISVYDHGNEIINDYGAARFLNIEAKRGGHYLPENKSYARHSIAHSTVTINETSHYGANVEKSEEHYSSLVYQDLKDERLQVTVARDSTAYDGVTMQRSITMVNEPTISDRPFIIDTYEILGAATAQLDMNYPFYGDIISLDIDYKRPENRTLLGKKDGYEHLEVLATGKAGSGQENVQFTFLQKQRFYTITTTATKNTDFLFTQTGANDPEFNLNLQRQFLVREQATGDHSFTSIIEPHGFFNPIKETVAQPLSVMSNVKSSLQNDFRVITFDSNGKSWVYTLSRKQNNDKQSHSITIDGATYSWTGNHQLFSKK
ncbi:MAG: heparinase II/III family protein [Nonlabens sp.]|nr:heparinase II/III family protein [Nonlabens sp.]